MINEEILIVIDMQVGFTTGSLANPDAVEIIPKIVNRIDKFDGNRIIVTRDTHHPNYLNTQEGRKLPIEHCIYGTVDWLVVPEIQTALNNAEVRGITVDYIDKETFGYNYWGGYISDDYEGTITMVGTCTGICVISNAAALKATCPEAEIDVIADECACLNETTHNTALEAMKLMQINIK